MHLDQNAKRATVYQKILASLSFCTASRHFAVPLLPDSHACESWSVRMVERPGTARSTLPQEYLLRNAKLQVARGSRLDLYVLLNAKIGPDFKVVDNSAITIASRTVSTFVHTEIRDTVFDTYQFARRSGMGFNISYIDKDITEPEGAGFDTAYMRSLYEYGYAKARSGAFWDKSPPAEPAPVTTALK